MLLLHAVGTLLLAGAARAAGPDQESELAGRVDAYLAPYIQAGHLSGTLLLARGEEVCYERSFGLADREQGTPNEPQTRFCIASVTKPMTVLIAVRLMEEGKLDPQATLDTWFPDFPRAAQITVDHLLNHRAGIPHRLSEDETVRRSAADMVELAAEHELLCEPGAQSNYSSGGFAVLAAVLELAGERPFSQLLADHVFAPAGMTRSVDSWDLDESVERANPYVLRAAGLIPAEAKDLTFLVGAGSVWSTPRDLFRLQRAAESGKLGPSAWANLRRETGLRWNGVTWGFRTFADYHLPEGLTVIFAGNVISGALDRIREDLPAILKGGEVTPRPVPQHEIAVVDREHLRSLAGDYEMRPGSLLQVKPADGGLMVNDWALIPIAGEQFYCPQDYGTVAFHDQGGAAGLVMRWKTAAYDGTYPRVAKP